MATSSGKRSRAKKSKQPYAIAMKDVSPFGLGGLWENRKNPSSGEWIRTFAIITTDANERVAKIHDRMPLILAPGRLRGCAVEVGTAAGTSCQQALGSRYRESATACIEMARDLEPARKLTILEMARIWLKLAEQAEKNGVAVPMYGTSVAQPLPKRGRKAGRHAARA
jgi:SOS response associated peptidase (SRAP)